MLNCICGCEFVENIIEHADNLPDGEPTYELDDIPTIIATQLVGNLVHCPECEKSYVMTISGETTAETTRMYLERA